MGDGCAHLTLDVVSDDRQACILELLRPRRSSGDEHGKGVNESAASVNRALRIEPRGILRADGQVAHDDVDLCFLERRDDINCGGIGFSDGFAVVLAQAIECHAALHGDARLRHVADLDGVVL